MRWLVDVPFSTPSPSHPHFIWLSLVVAHISETAFSLLYSTAHIVAQHCLNTQSHSIQGTTRLTILHVWAMRRIHCFKNNNNTNYKFPAMIRVHSQMVVALICFAVSMLPGSLPGSLVEIVISNGLDCRYFLVYFRLYVWGITWIPTNSLHSQTLFGRLAPVTRFHFFVPFFSAPASPFLTVVSGKLLLVPTF